MSVERIIESLKKHRRDLESTYSVPGLWVDFESEPAQVVNPYDFYAERLQDVLDTPAKEVVRDPHGTDWTRYAITYNLFPRVTTAFDHDGKNGLEQVNKSGWRETGSFLKAIAILPYISSMSFNTVHLLPITAIGHDGRKGTLGSPYAIQNPYRLDNNLCEPALPDLDAMTYFKAFVEVAHRLGLRVVMEFVLRTAARDSDWVKEHPHWFYWIRDDIPPREDGNPQHFGPPIWEWDTMNRIYQRVEQGDWYDLPAPSRSYRNMYTPPPPSDSIHKDGVRWIGVLEDGTRVRVPGAFTDWPLEGTQPPWSDVTYLRLYEHDEFNYMAYNTLRMYDRRLAQAENIQEDLWDAIVGILPFYQQTCGIDGVMIDMGHALPRELKRRIMQRAREIDPEFAFWGEDFDMGHRARDEGYNAVMGHLIFDLHQHEKMQAYIDWISHEEMPITAFTAPENHNTPRAAIRDNALGFCHQALLLMVALPGMPFIHSGFELFEKQPINTGLNFSWEMIAEYDQDKLPLFSEWSYKWTRQGNMVGAIRYSMYLRRTYQDILCDTDPATIRPGSSDNPKLMVFARRKGSLTLLFVLNTTMWDHQSGEAELYARDYLAQGLWGYEGATLLSDRLAIHVELGGGHSMMFKIEDAV